MAQTKLQPQYNVTSFAPLFDRLVDENPREQEEAEPLITYTLDETLRSVEQELSNLLNTRTSVIPFSLSIEPDELEEEGLSHRYGLPNLSDYNVLDSVGAQTLARQIRKTVETYESRITNVTVKILGLDKNQRLIIEIAGALKMDPYRERYTFPVVMQRERGD